MVLLLGHPVLVAKKELFFCITEPNKIHIFTLQ